MFNRISTDFLQGSSQYFVQQQQQRLYAIQQKLASGVNIQKTSDDPLNSTRLQQLQEATADDTQYTRNVDSLLSELNTTDSAITDLVQVVQRAKELSVQAGNDTLTPANLSAISKEVDQLINQAVQIGNTKLGQRFLFAGFAGTTTPFTRSGNNVTYHGTPASTVPGYARPGEVAPGVTIDANINAVTLLGGVTTATTPAPESVTSGNGILQTLTTLKLALEQGNKSSIRNQITQLGTDLETVTAVQADVGARVNRLDQVKSRLDSRQIVLETEKAHIQDIDIAKTISDLTFQQTLYQASLKVNADILKTSLLDYLR
jgi:flagellar hook-associated protein 3 FlgL